MNNHTMLPASLYGLSPSRELSKLTPRQEEIVRLVASGKLMREIATELEISRRTVEIHVQHVYRNLHMQPRIANLVRLAIRLGLVEA